MFEPLNKMYNIVPNKPFYSDCVLSFPFMLRRIENVYKHLKVLMANNVSTNITYNVNLGNLFAAVNKPVEFFRTFIADFIFFFVYTTCSRDGFAEWTSGICPVSKPILSICHSSRVFKIHLVMTSAC